MIVAIPTIFAFATSARFPVMFRSFTVVNPETLTSSKKLADPVSVKLVAPIPPLTSKSYSGIVEPIPTLRVSALA